MPSEDAGLKSAPTEWRAKHVYAMAIICLLVGGGLGYLFRGSESAAPPVQASTSVVPPESSPARMPTLDQMKQMADSKAQLLLDKLKTEPGNADLMVEIAKVYRATHQFKTAVEYYEKSLAIKPANVSVRTEMASCLYYSGDIDGALKQLERSIKDDPKNANALFNMGMIKLDGKKDSAGAVAAWRELLKTNPKLDPAKKAEVEKLIADAVKSGNKG
jgi:cytochrome c-type biogenesis protein CcmH/NrfG